MIFASVVFLCSLCLTLFLPVCFYDIKSEKEQRNGEYHIEMMEPITRLSGQSSASLQDKLTIKRLRYNISELAKELQLLKGTVGIYEKLEKVLEKDSSLATFGNRLHQNVLLTAISHSGDIFLGELFNRNSDIFYLFEPFHSLRYFRKNRPAEIYDFMVSSFLQGIFNCDFAKFNYFTEFLSRQHIALIHRLSSRTLSSPPLCPEVVTGRYYNIKLCSYLRPPTLSAICKLHAYTVVKTTQLTDLQRLSQLTDADQDGRPEYPFRIVELTRDPRAIIYTLLQEQRQRDNGSESVLTEEARKICNQQLRNIKYAQDSLLTKKERFILVKYEDLISNPLQAVDKLYGFLGIPVSPRVHSWLTNTLMDGFTWPVVQNSDGTVNKHTTLRNLTRSLTEWKTGLTDFQISLVERECSEVMSLLDYETFQKHV